MAAPDSQNLTIKVQCLCKAHTFTASVPVSSLPLKATTCHCDSCRYSTGALYTSDAPWPGDPAEVRAAQLSRYEFSDAVVILFCGTCGSTLFFEEKERDAQGAEMETSFGVFTGALPNVDVPGGGPLVAWEHHMYLGDTRDGGASPWLRTLDYRGDKFTTSRRWHGRRLKSEEVPEAEDWPSFSALKDLTTATSKLSISQGEQQQQKEQEQEQDKDITIPVRCKCGGVDLALLASAARREFAQMPRDELPRFVDPGSNKSVATFDVCDSCRLNSGVDIFHWTFYSLKHVVFAKGSTQEQDRGFPQSTFDLKKAVLAEDGQRDPRLGAIKMYASSPDVQRYFCGGCSAVVFYACDDLFKQVDVAIGLLHAPPAGKHGGGSSGDHGGARAEHLLSWKYGGKIGWREDTHGGWRDNMLKSVERDVTEWRDKRGLPKNWRIVEEEQKAAAEKAEAS